MNLGRDETDQCDSGRSRMSKSDDWIGRTLSHVSQITIVYWIHEVDNERALMIEEGQFTCRRRVLLMIPGNSEIRLYEYFPRSGREPLKRFDDVKVRR